MKTVIGVSIFLISLASQAHYRAFALRITNTENKTSRIVYSTLDWNQYYEYHYLQPKEVVTREDTWMCWRRKKKAFQSVCRRPGSEAAPKADFTGQWP